MDAPPLCEVILVCKHKMSIVGLGAKNVFSVCSSAALKKTYTMYAAKEIVTVSRRILFHVQQLFF